MKDLPQQIKALVLQTLQGSIAQKGEEQTLVPTFNLIQSMCSSEWKQSHIFPSLELFAAGAC